jgi:hypothetical protein
MASFTSAHLTFLLQKFNGGITRQQHRSVLPWMVLTSYNIRTRLSCQWKLARATLRLIYPLLGPASFEVPSARIFFLIPSSSGNAEHDWFQV